MRIVQYLSGATAGCGVQVGDDVFSTGYPTTLALVEDGDRGLEVAERASGGEPVTVDRVIHPLRPGKIFGSGINYKAHGEEAANFAAPDEPRWDFIKLSSSVIGPGEPIVIPSADDVIIARAQLGWEPAYGSIRDGIAQYAEHYGAFLAATS